MTKSLCDLHYIHAIQYLRSHLQELVEAGNIPQVDQALTKLLKQSSSEERADQFRELIGEYDKAYDWWTDFVNAVDGERGLMGSSSADASLNAPPALDPLLIVCKCGFPNKGLLSWSDNLPCQNPNGEQHVIEL